MPRGADRNGACLPCGPQARGHKRRALLALLCALGAVALASATPAAESATPPPPTTGAWRICTGCSDHGLGDGLAIQLRRPPHVAVRSPSRAEGGQSKHQGPRLQGRLGNSRSTPARAASTTRCCRRESATASRIKNHPEWFLLDTAGKRIQSCSWSSLWLMDVGSATYQQAWLDNVASGRQGTRVRRRHARRRQPEPDRPSLRQDDREVPAVRQTSPPRCRASWRRSGRVSRARGCS